jgi:hypothetical protein
MGAMVMYATQTLGLSSMGLDTTHFSWVGFVGTPKQLLLETLAKRRKGGKAAKSIRIVEPSVSAAGTDRVAPGIDIRNGGVVSMRTRGAELYAGEIAVGEVDTPSANSIDGAEDDDGGVSGDDGNDDYGDDGCASPRGVGSSVSDAALDFTGSAVPPYWILGFVTPGHKMFVDARVNATTRQGATAVAAIEQCVAAFATEGCVGQGERVSKGQAIAVATCVTPVTTQGYVTSHGPVCVIQAVVLSYTVVRAGMGGTVEKVVLTGLPTGGCRLDLILRSFVRCDVGNKLTTRHGQKGVVGRVVDEVDLPFDPATGLRASVVMYPHGTISRMFPSSMKDIAISMSLVVQGIPWADGSDSDIVAGLRPHMKFAETSGIMDASLVNGVTGTRMFGVASVGILYLEPLKQVARKVLQAHNGGPVDEMVKQPDQKHGKAGGLMEFNAAQASGSSAYSLDFMTKSCDPHTQLVCIWCGSIAFTRDGERYKCITPKCPGVGKSSFTAVSMPFAPIALANELAGLGVKMRIESSVQHRNSAGGHQKSKAALRALL